MSEPLHTHPQCPSCKAQLSPDVNKLAKLLSEYNRCSNVLPIYIHMAQEIINKMNEWIKR